MSHRADQTTGRAERRPKDERRQPIGAKDRVARRGPIRPYLSVIVPAHQAAEVLPRAMDALLGSDLPRDEWELIVVNDGYDEDTTRVAERYADAVVRLPGKPRGPSFARNRGAEIATGDVLVFIDSDVCVHTDTLKCFADLFRAEPEVAAAFGAYDDAPPAAGIVSRYRNLLHHYVHKTSPGDAETFWAGCGAIRREVFLEVGMYDEWHFARPQIEDIELGRRIRLMGHRILLRPEIQGRHLKRWTLAGVLETDFKHRGVPWTRLLLHEGGGAGRSALNISLGHRLCALLAGLLVLSIAGAALLWSWWPLAVGLLAVGGIVALNFGFFQLLRRRAGWVVALGAVPLHVLYYAGNGFSAIAGWLVFTLVGAPQPPPDVEAFEEIQLDTWPPIPSRPKDSIWYRHG